MAGNLKARLERIRAQGSSSLKPQVDGSLHWEALDLAHRQKSQYADPVTPATFPPPWVSLDRLVLFRRELIPLEVRAHETGNLSEFFTILCRGLIQAGPGINPQDLLFFDLETTGLSGGAGTVAFLAAFGEFTGASLEIRQYLLLDYPGESLFIEHIEKELTRKPHRVLVSYNGKAFDIPLLRSRFILQGRLLPETDHIDLLPLSRLLWTGLVPSCSQANLEAFVLQKGRQDDIPGALAPQIWFSFLREGPQGEALMNLLSVCHHNLLDIQGLAELFTLLLHIGSRPLEVLETIPFNLDRLALLWPAGDLQLAILHEAARRGSARALFALARLARQDSDWDAYRRYLEQILQVPSSAPGLSASALRLRASIALASFYEWKKGDLEQAEMYTRLALGLLEAAGAERRRAGARGLAPSINMKLEKRLKRILAKRQRSP
ncbi:ribonuclease H-like domain-containing protein [Gracilinema caldarium]|uniref:YprB ribonuclease H-like domain-containing protein n=1 Tax=Gracilinema caldarium (strain ATCC 51460 / DSM 7334 / H1) TaxID=744872 RepID=F8F1R2_GRAC1|nr:ribonuclease H-like domain-containing protein [Gracilinema caldarium]AEJ19396.1 hypothetical protein Spica_1250 [Gracilinema caldarium DSM 7334]